MFNLSVFFYFILLLLNSIIAESVFAGDNCSRKLQISYYEKSVGAKSLKSIPDYSKYLTYRVGDIIEIQDTKYKVIGFLGLGAEGEVFLVENSEMLLLAIKVFYNEDFKIGNTRQLHALRESSINTPLIVDESSTNKLVLEYVEGVEVFKIRYEYNELGIDKSEANSISKKYKAWKRESLNKCKLCEELSITIDDYNVLYNFESEKFTLIDPS